MRPRQEGLCTYAASSPSRAQRNRLEEPGCAGGHWEGAYRSGVGLCGRHLPASGCRGPVSAALARPPPRLGAGPCLTSAGSRAGGRAARRAHTVKMLERRLDCLRTGVGVEEAATVSMRSSRWLTLGVEGTEEE